VEPERLYDEIAPDYAEHVERHAKFNSAIDELIAKDVADGSSVADIGTGTGLRAAQLKRRRPGVRVTGFDISNEMLRRAMPSLDGGIRASLPNLPVRDNSFDHALCLYNTFGYLRTYDARVKALKDMARILKPGGRLYIDVVNRTNMGEQGEYKRGALTRRLLSAIPAYGFSKPGDLKFTMNVKGKQFTGDTHAFTLKELNHLFKKSGLTVVHKQVIGYTSGKPQTDPNRGQFFFVLEKA
jgi:ubiquinone/menaquinone biosynthesis C-methylase UbiE